MIFAGLFALIRSKKTGGPVIDLSGLTSVNENAIDPADAHAGIDFESDGDFTHTTNFGGTVDMGDWMNPKGGAAGSAYDIRVTPTSGTFSGGSATGSWLNLGSPRGWYVEHLGPSGTKSCTATYEIRDAVTLSVLATKAGIVHTATTEV